LQLAQKETEGNENPIAIAVVNGKEKNWNGKSECGKTLGGGNRSVGKKESEEKMNKYRVL